MNIACLWTDGAVKFVRVVAHPAPGTTRTSAICRRVTDITDAKLAERPCGDSEVPFGRRD